MSSPSLFIKLLDTNTCYLPGWGASGTSGGPRIHRSGTIPKQTHFKAFIESLSQGYILSQKLYIPHDLFFKWYFPQQIFPFTPFLHPFPLIVAFYLTKLLYFPQLTRLHFNRTKAYIFYGFHYLEYTELI